MLKGVRKVKTYIQGEGATAALNLMQRTKGRRSQLVT